MTITLAKQDFLLLPEKALFHEASQSLICSDVHIGKTTDLLRSGIQVPMETAKANIMKLESLIERYRPVSFYVLGDLFHARRNNEFDDFAELLACHEDLQFILVKGNHDFLPDSTYETLGLKVRRDAQLHGILLTHEADNKVQHSISGHLHPKVKLRGKGRQSASLPIFARTGNRLILPAFGRMTGGHFIQPEDFDDIYLCAQEQVIRWEAKPERARNPI
ncbi:MAG: ligase-associated DNA damage response endonuclease PdeM [Bacteroidetes bacterium]|nr:ligase-associated DNA damage response endonuclease PdeM [Bacteroidota bacterium]